MIPIIGNFYNLEIIDSAFKSYPNLAKSTGCFLCLEGTNARNMYYFAFPKNTLKKHSDLYPWHINIPTIIRRQFDIFWVHKSEIISEAPGYRL